MPRAGWKRPCEVRIIPEDPTYNGVILKPLASRILRECGRPNADVTVLTNPKVCGYEDAIRQLPAIIDRYSYVDLLLFLVDADGHDRSAAFARLEQIAAIEASS